MYNSLLSYIIKCIQPLRIYVAIDDSFIFRSRKIKVPNGYWDYDHAQKYNRSKFVWGQNLLVVVFILEYAEKKLIRLPFRIKLKTSSLTKIHYGRYMMRAAIIFLKRLNLIDRTIISFDSWFTNYQMIAKFASLVTIVAQAKLNYAFYHLPLEINGKRKKGAPKKYGQRLKQPTIEELKNEVTLHLYSQDMNIRYNDHIVKARFLKGMVVKIVYIQFPKAKKLRVFLATDITMSAVDIIMAYEKRWNVESFFYEYKHMLGLKDMMQHSLRTYYKWAYIRLISYNIINFLKIYYEKEIRSFISLSSPWRTTNKKIKLSISLRMAQTYFFSLFSSFDKTMLLHETINNSNEFLRQNGQASNNRGHKPEKFVDYLLKTG
jgi:hypothetical protein